MTSCWDAMVIGIGSDHGDDRVGWLVTDQLEKHCPPRVKCLKVTMPIDLIEWLDAAQQIHVVDAATEMDVAVCRLRYEFEQHRRMIAKLPPGGTHGFGLHRALELAESLERRTDHVNLWLVSGCRFLPFTAVSEVAGSAIDECVKRLLGELGKKDLG